MITRGRSSLAAVVRQRLKTSNDVMIAEALIKVVFGDFVGAELVKIRSDDR